MDLDAAADALTLMNTRLGATYGSSLTLSDMAYATLDSDIRSLYPTAVSDGIVLNYGDYSIRTIPISTGALVLPGAANVVETTSLTDNDTRTRVRYSNAFGTGTILQYTPTTMGVKEEVILTSNVGQNTFSFRMETGGLTLTEQNGRYVFLDPETQTVVARLGEVIAYDSNGQIAHGTVSVQSVTAGQRYNVTISVSPDFLANAAYPVSVDPSVQIEPDDYADPSLSLDDSGQKALEYVSVYSDSSGWEYTFDSILNIGLNTQYYDSIHFTGVMFSGRVFYRFPLFYNQYSPYHNLVSAQIQSFTLHMPTYSATNNTMSVTAYPATTKNWSPGLRLCNFALYHSYDTTYYDRGSRNAGTGIVSIDMTELARLWCDWESGFTDYTYGDPEYGVLLRPTNDNGDHCTVAAADVYVTLDYSPTGSMGNYYLNNRSNSGFLHAANDVLTTKHGLIETESTDLQDGELLASRMTWEFEYLGNDQYAIHLNGGDVVYLACNANGPYILYSSIGVSSYPQGRWTISSAYGGGVQLTTVSGYTLGVNAAGALVGTTASSFTDPAQKAWWLLDTEMYNQLPAEWTVSNIAVTPNETLNLHSHIVHGNYSLTSMQYFSVSYNNEYVTFQNGFLDGASSVTAEISVTHIPTNQTRTFNFKVDPLDSGTYYVQDGVSLKLMQSIDANTGVTLDSLDRLATERWVFEHYSDGYYVIKSADDTSKVLTVTTTGGVCLTTLVGLSSMQQRWKLIQNANFHVIIPLYSANTSCLTAANDSVLLGNYALLYSWNISAATRSFSQLTLNNGTDTPTAELNENIARMYANRNNVVGRTLASTTKNEFIQEVQDSTYFCAIMHGNGTHLGWEINESSRFTTTELDLAISENDVADLQLVILLACDSKVFVDLFAAKGVDNVIGFTGRIEQHVGVFWIETLFDQITRGATLGVAVTNANVATTRCFEGTDYDEACEQFVTLQYLDHINTSWRITQ